MEPLVSIITASYNKASLVEQTIKSVIEQKYSNWEHLIIDDASTDETIEVVKGYVGLDRRIKPIFNKDNKGANYCRNLGIKEAKGEYVIFLDADDLLARECLLKRVKIMREQSTLDFSVHSMLVFRKTIGDMTFKWMPVTKSPLTDFLSHKLPWQTMQPIWRRNFLLNLGGFDESFQRLQDVELHTRALLVDNVKYGLFNCEPDCYYRIDEERKNFDSISFLKRWVNSAIKYCDKFKDKIRKNERSYLMGTLYHTIIQLTLHLKNKSISKSDYSKLIESINGYSMVKDLVLIKGLTWKLAIIYNLHFVRLPGINRFFLIILTI